MSDSQAKAETLLQEFKGVDYAYGLGVLDRVGPLTAELGKRALFIGSLESEWFAPYRDKVLRALKTAGVEVVGAAMGAGPNAPFVDVYRMHSHIVHKKPEVIVAMGGGSTIDAAKAAAALASLGDITPEIDPFFGVGQITALTSEHQRPIMPVMAVMTAASSAAHLTKYSNITDPVAGQKKLIVDEAIVPPKAVFDYEITVRQHENLTLDGALDGVSHCVEVYLGAAPEVEAKTGEICQAALDLIIPGVLQASRDPQDLDARVHLGLGTDLGGYAIMVGGTSGPHLNSFSLVDVLSHGRACAVMNPYYTVFFAPAVEEKLRRVGEVYRNHGLITKDLAGLSGRDLGVAVAEGMLNLSREIGFPTRLQDVPGVSRTHVERCLTAAKNPVLDMKLRNMPVPLNADLVDEYMGSILEAAWREDFSLIKTLA